MSVLQAKVRHSFSGRDLAHTCRKIRCCGGAPCRNCARSKRECDYAPVPEEVNRATREKKAIAKASKTDPSPAPSYSPFFGETPVYDVPYASSPVRPHLLSHRRSVSVPNFEASHRNPPPTPTLHSPAMFESAHWMYSPWSSAPAITLPEEWTATRAYPSAYPSVFEQVPSQEVYLAQCGPATPSDSRSSSTERDPHPPFGTSWSAPNVSNYFRPPMPLTPLSTQTYDHKSSPLITPYRTLYPSPPLFLQPHRCSPSPLAHSNSPTLAPEMSLPSKDLVGLGIGTNEDVYHTASFLPDEYITSPHF